MRAALSILVLISVLPGCSWDYPVWSKNKKSDTPLFRFVVGERYGAGYIDRQGRIVIQPQFLGIGNYGGDFFDGLAQVTTKDQGSVYIDSTGKRVITSGGGSEFSNGLAVRWFRNLRKYGYMDRTGRDVIPPTFESAGGFSEGLANVKVSGHWGYIDAKGKMVIAPQFSYATRFADGHALVIVNGPCQYIGYGPCEYPMNPPYRLPSGRTDDPLPSTWARCKYSVIDKTGKVLFTGPFIDAKHFAEGLAPIGDGTKWGFVDAKGQVRIPLQFENAEPFSEGFARVQLGGKWGFVDRSGKFVIKPQFTYAEDFSEGLAVAMEGYKYWFVGKNGERAFPETFDAASGFAMGLAHVRSGIDYYSAKWSYIDKTGKAVFSYSDQSKRNQ